MTALSVLFQWFLMLLSVRPGGSLAITAHLLPCTCGAHVKGALSWWAWACCTARLAARDPRHAVPQTGNLMMRTQCLICQQALRTTRTQDAYWLPAIAV